MLEWLHHGEGVLLCYVTFGPLAIKNKTMRLVKEQFWLCMCFSSAFLCGWMVYGTDVLMEI